MPKQSDLERAFQTIWTQLGGPELTPEYKFTIDRKWTFDFALPDKMIGIEIEGGIFSGGRHTRGVGYTNDCEKYNEAQLLGWRVFRFTSPMFDDPDKYIKPVVDLVSLVPCEICKRPTQADSRICEECIPY